MIPYRLTIFSNENWIDFESPILKKKKAADSAEKDYRNFLKTYSVKKNILIKI